MSFKQAATTLVCEALDGQFDFLVLRGLDDRAREDGDIDVLVPCGRASQALLRVTERAVESGWTVAGVSDIGYLTQICLVRRRVDDRVHCAVKVDFFNGAAWAASGADPLGRALFEGVRGTLSVAEAIGLATLLQKMLYAGYLRDRDRDRIEAVCTAEGIMAFIDVTGLPLSFADVKRGRLSRRSQWRMRAASAGVGVAGMPSWSLRVIRIKLQFTFVCSTIPGRILLVTGADEYRRAAVTARFRALLESAGFPSPVAVPDTVMGRLELTWRRLRGETVVLQSASSRSRATSTASLARMLQVQILTGGRDASDDLETILTVMSQHILQTLRRKVPS